MPRKPSTMTWVLVSLFTLTTACSSCDENNTNNNTDMKNNPDLSKMDMDKKGDMTLDMTEKDMTEKDMTQNAEVVVCPTVVPVATSGLCDVTAGNADAVVIKGTVLSGDKIYENGTVVVDRAGENGTILCVGCDCDNEVKAQGATTLSCGSAVISPGLINAHDHITYNSKGEPKAHPGEKFDHRHDWRVGKRGHKAVRHNGNSSAAEAVLIGELRHLMAGTTSLAGSGGAKGFLRNLDQSSNNGNLPGNIKVDYSTFPLGDVSGTLIAEGCDRYNLENERALENTVYLPHVSEGIDDEARNEFFCMAGGSGKDYIRANTTIIHGIGLTAGDIGQMAADGAKLIWSPRSNIDLYGQTAEVITYDKQGVVVGLGTDWVISGSVNMLRELQCADYLNTTHYNKYFSDLQLWKMATGNNAVALGVDGQIGTLEKGKIADIAIFDGTTNKQYRAVLDAGTKDVALVLRGGQPLYGAQPLVEALLSTEKIADCETLDVCSEQKTLCAKLDTGFTLATLKSGAGDIPYDLFFCGEPTNEPSCQPSRPNEYMGVSGDDSDGDGVPDTQDSCPNVFNPKRPQGGNVQPNHDGDTFGDVCDLCVYNEGMPCVPYDSGDIDGDGVPTTMDNCPFKPNKDQMDQDNDKIGDVCDACPADANPDGAGCPATIYSIKKGEVEQGVRIALNDVVVSGSGLDGFFIQVPTDRANYPGVANSGLFVFAKDIDPKPAPGDRIKLNGTVSEYQNQVQLSEVKQADLTVVSQGAEPVPVNVTESEILNMGARGVELEGVLVRVDNVEVKDVEYTMSYSQFTLVGGLVVDDILYKPTEPTVGDTYTAIVGPISFRFGENHIAPRSENDLIQGPAELQELTPATTYIKAGTTTQPTPGLVVKLTSSAQQNTTVNLSYSDSNVLTGPSSVVIMTGQSEAVLTLQGVSASATPQVITAESDNITKTSSVVVYDDATVRNVVEIMPSSATIAANQSATLTITLNLPGAAGGTTVTLSTSNSILTVPGTVTVPEGMLSVDVPVTSGAMTGVETITAKIGQAAGKSTMVTISALPSNCLIFSEYGESGPFKFVELYNCGSSDVDLSTISLCLVSNTNTTCSNVTKLSGTLTSGAVRVICNSSATEQACQEKLSIINFNGDDRILMFKDTNDNSTLDANEDVVDSFGQASMPPASKLWEDVVYRRCDLTPYDGTTAFVAASYYSEVKLMNMLDVSELGQVPSMMSCP